MVHNEDVVRQIKNGIDVRDNMELLYNNNKRLIYAIAKRVTAGSLTADLYGELMQEAYFALHNAVQSYDLDGSVKFSTVFGNALKWRFYNYLAKLPSGSIHVPPFFTAKIRKYKELKDSGINNELICIRMKISKAELDLIRQTAAAVVSLDSPVSGEGEEIALIDTVGSDCRGYEDVEKAFDNIHLYRLVKSILTPPQMNIIYLRFWQGMSRQRAADETGSTLNAVTNTERNALWSLCHNTKIKAYYSDCIHRHVGIKEFRQTNTSATEWAVLRRYVLKEMIF